MRHPALFEICWPLANTKCSYMIWYDIWYDMIWYDICLLQLCFQPVAAVHKSNTVIRQHTVFSGELVQNSSLYIEVNTAQAGVCTATLQHCTVLSMAKVMNLNGVENRQRQTTQNRNKRNTVSQSVSRSVGKCLSYEVH